MLHFDRTKLDMIVMSQERWQLSGSGPESYERYQVPSVFEPLARLFLDRVPLAPGQRVIDIACGTGIVARLAARVVGETGEILGVDLNPAMLDVARENAPPTGPTMVWKEGDAAALPCDDGAFDVALCQQGLQFFPDKVAALREMHRALVPGGIAAICVWQGAEHSPFITAVADALTRHLSADAAARVKAPFALGDEDELRAHFEEAGFKDVEIEATPIIRRMLPPEESVPGQLAATPVGPEVAALDEATRNAMVEDIGAALAGYRDDAGMAVPQGTFIVLANS